MSLMAGVGHKQSLASMTWAKRLKRVFNIDIAYRDVGKGREQDAVALKPVVNAAVRSGLLPASDYTDVGGRAMPGAIAEKTRR